MEVDTVRPLYNALPCGYYQVLMELACFQPLRRLVCGMFMPHCSPQGGVLQPCRSVCSWAAQQCSQALDVFTFSWPFNCHLLPDSQDPMECSSPWSIAPAPFICYSTTIVMRWIQHRTIRTLKNTIKAPIFSRNLGSLAVSLGHWTSSSKDLYMQKESQCCTSAASIWF